MTGRCDRTAFFQQINNHVDDVINRRDTTDQIDINICADCANVIADQLMEISLRILDAVKNKAPEFYKVPSA